MKTHNTAKPQRNLTSLLRAAAACVLFSGGLALAQPTISSIYPNGSVQFQWTNKLTFVTGGTAAVTNISVTLAGKPMSSAPLIRIYTSAAGLTINGNNVSAPLQSNVVYTATIVATDATGASTTNTASFDTIRPTYTFEAEDWDYDGGQYIDNPPLNAYAGKVGVDNTDAHDGATGVGTAYRPANPGNLGNEGNGDTPRTQYLSSGQTDYDVGWNNSGNWGNYTRHYPAGKWNIFMRGANPNASGTDSANVLLGGIFGTFLGQFAVPNTGGWQAYTWVPMTDSSGNLIEWDTDGTVQPLTVDTAGGNYNANFYLLLPVPPALTQDATLSSIFPDGTYQFQSTNSFSFTINSSLGVQPANILVTLNGISLTAKSTSAIYQVGSGLSVSGPATALVVTFPLATNTFYTAALQVLDANNFTVAQTVKFDTVNPSYTWESEDFDYGGGQFVDNPQTNAYALLQATLGVDGYNPNHGGQSYRPVDQTVADGNQGNEGNGDTKRLQYMDPMNPQTDYDVGWTTAGSRLWENYTRHFPAGKWNIFMRGAANDHTATLTTPNALLYLGGTNGAVLGRFVVTNQASWQIYATVPLVDVAGNLIEWDTDGSQKTLTILCTGGGYNANYYMLTPVDPNYKPLPFINPINPDGTTTMFCYTNLLSFTANSVPGIVSSNVVVTLNGVKATGLTFSGSSHALNVTCPIATNAVYALKITLTDANGSSTYSTSLGTFPASSYTFELEDWDHDSGQFFDHPPVDAYATLSGVELVDGHSTSTGSQTYRPAPGGLCTENCGDLKRAQYVSAGTNDYDIAFTGGGQWANYTRTYPAGVYNVFLRASSPNANGQNDAARLLWVTNGVGTSTQGTSLIGTFNVPATGGWQNYSWAPLVDANGNQVPVTTTGNVSTFQYHEDNGGHNANFILLAPVDTAKPVLSQVYPNGSAMFQQTNKFSFVVSSSAGIQTNGIVVTLNGVVVSNLVFSGTATNMTVSCPVQPNTAYTATVTVTSLNNDTTTTSYIFDTFSSGNYTFEAEDWDYNGGHYVTNYTLNAYAGLVGVTNVDAYNASGGGTSYRTNDPGNLGNEVAGDVLRTQYASAATNDYDIGWTAKGNWANYTRTYPTGTFNIYLRVASPGGAKAGANLSWVTSGLGTTNQTTNSLGIFNMSVTGGNQIWTFTPLVDTNGSLVYVTTTGAASTLRLSELAGGWNANFLMFVPATTPPSLSVSRSGGNVVISWTPNAGHLLSSPAVAGSSINWQPVAGATNSPVTIPITGSRQFFRVVDP